ncbi:hypothetical protein MMC13_005698 [Lambiella insularis]|nr:hypothetical protein [Lambiella insularis]
MDPKGPSQPGIDTAYDTVGNPADQTAQEHATAASKESTNAGATVEERKQGDVSVPSVHGGGPTASSLGAGVRTTSGDKGESIGPGASDLEGEQMRAPGEGDVYRSQSEKSGFGEQEDLASDLDRKKEEQSQKREEIKESRKDAVDIGGALGGRTGPSVVEGR